MLTYSGIASLGAATLDARGAFRKALTLHRDGDLAAAIDLYRVALAANPGDASAWHNLGIALRATGEVDLAVACHQRARHLNPQSPEVVASLGNALKDLGRVDEAVAAHRAVVAAKPGEATAHHNLGIALKQAGDLDGALAAFETAIRLDPEKLGPAWDRALVLLHLGRFAEGWDAYESRWRLKHNAYRGHGLPRWRGERFDGRTLLVWREQGFGDAIIAARFLPLVKARGGTVVLECKPELRRLFESLEGVDGLVAPGDPGRADLECPALSLPGFLGIGRDRLPPPARLHAPAADRLRWRSRLASDRDRLKVGIVWSGSPTFKGNRTRATSLHRFLALADVPDVALYSLQTGPPARALSEVPGARDRIADLGSDVSDFADTAAAVSELDLVIMTDTAVAHVAGSLGTPIWNLLNFVPYWLYGQHGQSTPWYPSMRLLRQPRAGEWDSVFKAAASALNAAAVAKREGRWPQPSAPEAGTVETGTRAAAAGC